MPTRPRRRPKRQRPRSGSSDPPATEAPTTDPPSTEAPTTEAPTATTAAASGTGLDATFGTDGILLSPQSETDNDRAISVAQGADGLIYTAGFTSIGDDHMFAVSRFTDDGAPDPSFGDGGTAAINVTEGGGGAEVARGLVVQDDGMVLVAGPFEKDPTAEGDAAGDLDIAVIRLDATGPPTRRSVRTASPRSTSVPARRSTPRRTSPTTRGV